MHLGVGDFEPVARAIDDFLEQRTAVIGSEASQPATHAAPANQLAGDVTCNRFVQEGEYWTIVFQGKLFRLRNAKGIHHIARLLREPGRAVPAADMLLEQDGDGGERRELAGDESAVLRGLAGLVTAKVLHEDGFDVTVFEKGATLGGVWSASRTYPGLRANNPRETYAFSDHPFPRTADAFPTAEQMRAYLESYARRFGLVERIRLATTVLRVRRVDGAAAGMPSWQVTVASAARPQEEEATLDFDFVVVCNGVFSRPSMPAIEGAERFEGMIRHSSELSEPGLVGGKRVVVVGASKSALDCAAWAATQGKSCTLVFRQPYWMWPRYWFGLVNIQWLMFSRLSAALVGYHRPSRLEAFLQGVGRPLVSAAWAAMNRLLRAEGAGLGALMPDVGLPEHLESFGVGTEAYGLVRGGRITPMRTTIRRLRGGKTVELADGRTIQADLIICATGYTQEVPFLEESVRRRVERESGFRLYRMILPPEHRTLAFNGYNSSTACQMTAEVAAHWISDCFSGALTLPSVAEMDREIEALGRWLRRVMPSRSQGFFIGPCLIHYIDDLLHDMGLRSRRRRNPIAEHVLPAWPRNYRTLGEERRRRARGASRSYRPGTLLPSTRRWRSHFSDRCSGPASHGNARA